MSEWEFNEENVTKYYVDNDTISVYYTVVDNYGWESHSDEREMTEKEILKVFTDEYLEDYDKHNADEIKRIVTQLRRDYNINEILT